VGRQAEGAIGYILIHIRRDMVLSVSDYCRIFSGGEIKQNGYVVQIIPIYLVEDEPLKRECQILGVMTDRLKPFGYQWTERVLRRGRDAVLQDKDEAGRRSGQR
jgi:hypothetical protein